MNPQMAKTLMDEVKNQGENINMTLTVQIPIGKPGIFSPAENVADLCNSSSDFFLRNLGDQLEKTLKTLQQKKAAYDARQSHYNDLPEEPLDEDIPSYGRRK
jgi:hypothetical protein